MPVTHWLWIALWISWGIPVLALWTARVHRVGTAGVVPVAAGTFASQRCPRPVDKRNLPAASGLSGILPTLAGLLSILLRVRRRRSGVLERLDRPSGRRVGRLCSYEPQRVVEIICAGQQVRMRP